MRATGPVRLLTGLVVLVLLSSGCRSLGPGLPVCGELALDDRGDRIVVTDAAGVTVPVRSSHLLQLQAVPGAAAGVCVSELPVGWQVAVDEPRSGSFGIGVSAAALGGRFLDVQLLESCEPSDIASEVRTRADARRWVTADEVPRVVVTVVPAEERHRRAGWDVAVQLIGRQVRGNALRVEVAPVERGSVEERTAAAHAAGSFVLVVTDGFEIDGTLALHGPRAAPMIGSMGGLLAELADRAPRPRVQATWWDVYDDHCVVHHLDARGEGATAARAQVDATIGSFPLDELRAQLRTLGHEVAP